jgi:hypothetical protein
MDWATFITNSRVCRSFDERSHGRNILDMSSCDNMFMMAQEVDPADLAALNELVQRGFADVVTIEDGEPFYTLGSRFVPGAAPESSA